MNTSYSNGIHLLTALFEARDYFRLESEAKRIVELTPEGGKAWHLLGLSYLMQDRNELARAAFDRALDLLHNDDEVLDHLGLALYRQGLHDDAAECFEKSLTIKPDRCATWNNAEINAAAASRYEKAIEYSKRAVELNPNDGKAFVNLGNALKGLREIDGAEASYRKALEIDPLLPEAHNNLGAVLRLKRKAEEGLRCIERALELRPSYIDAHCNRVDTLAVLGRLDDADASLNVLANLIVRHNAVHYRFTNLWLSAAISSATTRHQLSNRVAILLRLNTQCRRYKGLLATYAMIFLWTEGHFEEVSRIADAYRDFGLLRDTEDDRFVRVFFNYLRDLLAYRSSHPVHYREVSASVINVIGESHCLSPSHAVFDWKGQKVRARSHFIMGAKMYHLADKRENLYKRQFTEHLLGVTGSNAPLLVAVGEIDCRADSGIWAAARKKRRPVMELVDETVKEYLSFLEGALSKTTAGNVTVQGVPAPAYQLDGENDPGDAAGFLAMIKAVNRQLRAGALRHGWQFLDVYSATAAPDGMSNRRFHLDGWHLKPSFYADAEQWLVIP